jgi:hypothetical protein
MKIPTVCSAAILLSSTLVLSCSRPVGSLPELSRPGMALGEIPVERCLFYCEAENFKEKSGGDIDLKGGASNGKCLGARWGEQTSDFAAYGITMEETTESVLLVFRAAFEGSLPQSYEILIDGRTVYGATLNPTGGYGYVEKEWQCFSAPLGRIDKGPHTLTIRPFKNGEIINIDCLALGIAG